MDDGRRPRQYPSRRAIVLEGILAVADCDAEDDRAYRAAWARFWASVRAAGWQPGKDDAEPGAE